MYRCTHQADTYGYNVTFSGVGLPPPERADVGHCSQTALFRRKDGTDKTAREQSQEQTVESEYREEKPYVMVSTLFSFFSIG